MADYRDIWSPAKVFSPSVARQQSQLAKDWTYVDQWLLTRHSPSPVPSFERNPDTLKALLALAAANEAADEERALEKKVKEKTLSDLQKRDEEAAKTETSILAALEENLTPDGTRALNSIALLSVALGSTSTSSRKLAASLIELTKEEFSIAQQTLRIDGLHKRLQRDLLQLQEQLRALEHGDEYKVPPELAGQAAEWTRTSRHLQRKTEDYQERVEALEVLFPPPPQCLRHRTVVINSLLFRMNMPPPAPHPVSRSKRSSTRRRLCWRSKNMS